eukprot:3532006-Amphidinium_carterae.1
MGAPCCECSSVLTSAESYTLFSLTQSIACDVLPVGSDMGQRDRTISAPWCAFPWPYCLLEFVSPLAVRTRDPSAPRGKMARFTRTKAVPSGRERTTKQCAPPASSTALTTNKTVKNVC